MASDGHSLAALGSARDEAEIDQGDFGALEMADEIGKDAGVKAPAVDEDETHLQRGASRMALAGPAVSASTSRSGSISTLLMRRGEGQPEPRRAGRHGRRPDRCRPEAGSRRRSLKLKSRFRRSHDHRHDLRGRGAGIEPNGSQRRCESARPSARHRRASSSMPGTRSSAASMAPSTGGGSAVE